MKLIKYPTWIIKTDEDGPNERKWLVDHTTEPNLRAFRDAWRERARDWDAGRAGAG